MKNNFPKIPLLISSLLFFICLFVFLYLYKDIKNNNKESQLAETQWQTEALRRDEIKMLDYSIKIIEKERTQLETHFAQSSDVVPFLDIIEGLAPRANIKAEVVSVDILDNHNGLMVGMKASGSFNGLYKFLTLLENSPYELEFISMDIQKEMELDIPGKKVEVSKWDAVFKIKLLSFIQ